MVQGQLKIKLIKFGKQAHVLELYSEKFTWEKVNYIYQNPVRAGFIEKQEDWIYSSATNYADKEENVLKEVICLAPRLITVK